jgi:hypothetical protein
MRRYLEALLSIFMLSIAPLASASLLQGSFDGVIAYSFNEIIQRGQTISGDFVIECGSPFGGADAISVKSYHLFLDGQTLVSPNAISGWGWMQDDTVRIGEDLATDSVSIYLGWASASWRRDRYGYSFETEEPPSGPLEFIGYGVGFEFSGPTSWFQSGDDLKSILANLSSASMTTWLEIKYGYGDFIDLSPGASVDFSLTQFHLVPEPNSILVTALIAASLTHRSRSLRWRFLPA